MKKLFGVLGLIFGYLALSAASTEARLLRFPDINGQLLVFVYAGDIWSVEAAGGEARRLTSHAGMELFPKISPDGQWIAFSAEYSGSRQVYVIPARGGTPRQLTYYNDVGMLPPRGGFDYRVLDWTPDSQKILVRANRTPWGERMGKYFLVSLAGGLETALPIPEAGGGTFSSDAKKIVYTPIEREFRTWKRYRGGRAQDIWIYDLENNRSQKITDFPGTDQHPIWHQDRIYFVSDRELKLNIYSCDLQGGKLQKVTNHDEYDVLWPSGRNGQIVYENGGYIYRLQLDSLKTARVAISLDFDSPATLPYFKNVTGTIHSFDISPSGKRALFDARGDIFTVPEKEGIIENLTRTPGVREMYPAWSPDGKWIAYYSDQSGEYEIVIRDKDNLNSPRQLTQDSRIWRYPAQWSPDSRKLLFSDKNQLLQILEVQSRTLKVVDQASLYDITEYGWSPDSQWVVYTKNSGNGQDAIWVYSLGRQQATQLTDGFYACNNPVFSRCGRHIFFLSNRDFNLSFSSFEFDYLYNKATRIYAMALTPGVPAIIADKNDVEETKKPQPGKSEKKKKGEDAVGVQPVEIDFLNINSRMVAFPLDAGDYDGLWAVDKGILFSKDGTLSQYNVEEKKSSTVIKDIGRIALSADGQKILYRAKDKYGIIDIKPDQKVGDGLLKLDGLELKIEPLKEWQQIFLDAWRIFRDWFYVKNLHGVDWGRMRQRYGQLVSSLGHRADLDYILGELVAEINAGHCYINWGDFAKVPRIDTGLLGAELKADQPSGRYVIAKIYKGENWKEDTRSPLTEQGVAVNEGDFLLAINGHELFFRDNPYQFLENTVGKRIPILVNSRSEKTGAREFLIKPIASELKLFNLDWVLGRRAMVDKLSSGRIGYIHVPNTSREGNEELFKGMYAYKHKEALIIDDRYNGGGFIPDVMADLISRKILNFWARRGLDIQADPNVAHDGPKVMLINHYSSSGGDAFPYYFRKKNLGLIIGTRTWGGLIGISGNPDFVDGGSMDVPTFGFVDTEGNWAVEGQGVSPDIEVEDRPELVAQGRDPCIEKAVEVLLQELAKKPAKKIVIPKEPDRSKWIENEEIR